jgi:rubrerythrin
MTSIPEIPKIASAKEFYAQALAIESEASEPYTALAEQMEVHNNRAAATIFRRMAEVESQHRDLLRQRAGDMLIDGERARFCWIAPEGPDVTEFSEVHYLMSPHHALQTAKLNEERAAAWFDAISKSAADPEIKAIAQRERVRAKL